MFLQTNFWLQLQFSTFFLYTVLCNSFRYSATFRCMSHPGVRTITPVEGRLDSVRYGQLLEKMMLPPATGRSISFINRTMHPAMCERIRWPFWLEGGSPDMNPIECLWDKLERQLQNEAKATCTSE